MPGFTDPWDLTTPPNTEGVTNGDDRIREMKRALDQRLGALFAGWPNTNPLKLLQSAFLTTVDVLAVPNGVPTNLAAAPGATDGLYVVTAQGFGLASTQITTALLASSSNNTFVLFNEQKPAGSTLTLSNPVGGNIAVTQTSGVAMNVRLSYYRIA